MIMTMDVLENVNSFLFAVMMTMKMALYILVHFFFDDTVITIMTKRNYDDDEKKS